MHNLDGLTLFFFLVAVLLGFGGSIWWIAEAFRKSIPWGLAVLFIPFASLAFLVTNLDRAGKPFLMSLASTAIVILLGTINKNFLEALNVDGHKNEIAQANVKTSPQGAENIAPPVVKHIAAKQAQVHHSAKHHDHH